jgi:hypothetical protein
MTRRGASQVATGVPLGKLHAELWIRPAHVLSKCAYCRRLVHAPLNVRAHSTVHVTVIRGGNLHSAGMTRVPKQHWTSALAWLSFCGACRESPLNKCVLDHALSAVRHFEEISVWYGER